MKFAKKGKTEKITLKVKNIFIRHFFSLSLLSRVYQPWKPLGNYQFHHLPLI
jgi:hypothetical protein